MESKYKASILKELDGITDNLARGTEMREFVESLSDKIDGMNSDMDIKKFLWANRLMLSRRLTSDVTEDATNFKDIIYGEAPTGTIDYNKSFGKNWEKNFLDMDVDKIKWIAEKNGVDWKDLYNDMSKKSLAYTREKIAKGEDLGGWFDSPASFGHNLAGAITGFVAPRQQEDIARGEEPSMTDIALDAGQNILYSMPWGRGLGVVGKALQTGNKAAKVAGNVGKYAVNNGFTPLAMEALDAAAYDEDNPRGEFSWGDVASGTAVNATMPFVMKGVASGAGKLGVSGAKKVTQLGEGKTTEEIVDELSKKYKEFKIANADNPNVSNEIRQFSNELKMLSESNPHAYQLLTSQPSTLWEIAKSKGKTLEEKTKNYLKKNGDNPEAATVFGNGDIYSGENIEQLVNTLDQLGEHVPTELRMIAFTPKEKQAEMIKKAYTPVSKEFMNNYDNYVGRAIENAKPLNQLMAEESMLNYITNKTGDYKYEQQSPFTRIPLVGQYIDEQLKEDKEEKEKEKQEKEIMDKYRWDYKKAGK